MLVFTYLDLPIHSIIYGKGCTVGSGDHGCLIFAKYQTSGDNSKIQISGESLKYLKVFRDIWSTKQTLYNKWHQQEKIDDQLNLQL